MSTQHRIRDTYRVELREKDHLPPHVHLTGAGVDVLIHLDPVVVKEGKAPKAVLAEALAWIRANQAHLLKEWTKWHP